MIVIAVIALSAKKFWKNMSDRGGRGSQHLAGQPGFRICHCGHSRHGPKPPVAPSGLKAMPASRRRPTANRMATPSVSGKVKLLPLNELRLTLPSYGRKLVTA